MNRPGGLVSILFTFGILCATLGAAHAAGSPASTPAVLHYQAKVAASNGASIEGNIAVKVFLYDSPTEGVPGDLNDSHLLYAEDHGDVAVERGMLRFTIGDGEALGRFAGMPLPIESLAAAGGIFIDLSLEGERLQPRQSAGFSVASLRAQFARSADPMTTPIQLTAANLPVEGFPAAKVSGVIASTERIPALSAGWLSSAVTSARIPDEIPPSRVSSGTLANVQLPTIPATKIGGTTTFAAGQISAEIMREGQLDISVGSAMNGEAIALPVGFDPSQCAWLVGLGDNADHTVDDGFNFLRAHTGSLEEFDRDTTVTCSFSKDGSDVHPCRVNYIAICKS